MLETTHNANKTNVY